MVPSWYVPVGTISNNRNGVLAYRWFLLSYLMKESEVQATNCFPRYLGTISGNLGNVVMLLRDTHVSRECFMRVISVVHVHSCWRVSVPSPKTRPETPLDLSYSTKDPYHGVLAIYRHPNSEKQHEERKKRRPACSKQTAPVEALRFEEYYWIW